MNFIEVFQILVAYAAYEEAFANYNKDFRPVTNHTIYVNLALRLYSIEQVVRFSQSSLQNEI